MVLEAKRLERLLHAPRVTDAAANLLDAQYITYYSQAATDLDDRYFAGAMLCNLLLAELLFAVAFVTAVLLTWPAVPWDGLTYAMAFAMAASACLPAPPSRSVAPSG